jgi:DNA polymerase V
MDMIDNVNFSMRDDVLKFAASGTDRDWKMRQELGVGGILQDGGNVE